jgi:integrase/recombinase XerD
MASLKLFLDTRRVKADGTYNIIFRITHLRKVFTINSGISVDGKYWNKHTSEVLKAHPNAKRINLKLNKDYFLLQDGILRLDDQFTIEKLRVLAGREEFNHETTTFKAFADKLISQMFESKRTGNAIVYQTAVNRFLQFYGKDDIPFDNINYKLLDGFIHSLTVQGLKINSISNYLRSLRAIYNRAIKEKLVERSLYPFYDIKIKVEKTQKRAISNDDVLKLKNAAVEVGSAPWKAINFFFLSYCLIGISFTDLAYLTKENIVDGRIVYRRRKTHKNYSIRLFPEAEVILNKLKSNNSTYLLNIITSDVPEDSIEAKKRISQWIKTTNKYLKRISESEKINGKITTYVARHQFANTAKRLGYSNELIADSLGHEYGNKITNIYLDSFDREVVDEMHYKVISQSN